jgi:mono/diheme cytochrome c family protein
LGEEEAELMSVFSKKTGLLAAAINVVVLSAVNTPLSAEGFERGEALYENHCKECHEGLAHTRHGSKINSFDDIRSWVASWSVHSRLDWSGEEVNDVAEYLNDRFYHLAERP